MGILGAQVRLTLAKRATLVPLQGTLYANGNELRVLEMISLQQAARTLLFFQTRPPGQGCRVHRSALKALSHLHQLHSATSMPSQASSKRLSCRYIRDALAELSLLAHLLS